MHKLLSRMMQRHTPVMNERVMNGLASTAMEHLEEYIDAQIRSICVGMPSSVRYVGYAQCSVDEEYREVTRIHSNRRYYNLAQSTVYLMKYFFEFIDELGEIHPITKYIYLPYVLPGGIIQMSGTEMHLIPVLSDKVFTASGDSVFVRLVQDRNNFFRTYHTIILNGRRESRYVAHAEIYRSPSKGRANKTREVTTRALTVLPHYLFARYGFYGAFKRYAGIEPIVGDSTTITAAKYPPEDWVIACSTRLQPPKTNIDLMYQPTDIRLAIRKDQWCHQVECLVVGFFYVVDHFPTRFEATKESVDDCALWMILIGHIRFSGSYPENKLYSSISEHFETIEPYLDQAVKDKLAQSNIHLENYFDLLNYIQVMFDDFILLNEQNGLSVYGKNLEILHWVVYDILYGFTLTKFKLNKIASRNALTLNHVETHIRRVIRVGAVFDLSSGNKIVCEVVGYSGDHKYPKITAIVAEQENRSGGDRDTEKRIVPGPEHWLDLSMVTTGSILNLPKSNPTPMVRINPWICIDETTGTILPNPKFIKLIEENKALFKL